MKVSNSSLLDPMNRDHKQYARDALLAEMGQHNLAIIRIKTRLNMLVPTASLPPELLAYIFQIVVDSYKDNRRLVSTSPPYAWISLTHVCTHWRAVALATPTLWSEIVLPCRLPCVAEMLTRSQGVPLSVYHRLASSHRRRPEDLQSLEIALRALHRVRTLSLYLPWEIYRRVAYLLSAPAPLLKELTLSTSNMLSCIGRAPPILFINHTIHPVLETLDLSAYSVLWQGLASCHTLRTFSLDYASFMRPTLHTVSEVLDTLRGLPLLESLRLTHVLLSPLPAEGAVDHSRVVLLPKLEQISLCGDAAPSASLLDNIMHPSSTRLELNHSNIDETEIPILLPSIRTKLSGGSTIDSRPPTPFRSLAFGLDFKRSLVIRGWSIPLDMDCEAELEDIPATFQLELPRWALEFPHIWDILPLHEVRSLWMLSNLPEELSTQALSDVLERMPQVAAVCVVDWSARSLEELLVGPVIRRGLEADADGASQLVLPKMHELVLRDVSFDACFGHKEGHVNCLQDLGNVLRARHRHGAAKVTRVALSKCVHVIGHHVEYLKHAVDEVVWDGVVRIRDDLSTDSESEGGMEIVEGYED